MNVQSTRSELEVTMKEALRHGLAKDSGLYVPKSIPSFELDSLVGLTYQELCCKLMGYYFDELEPDQLATLIAQAYASFDHPDCVPLTTCGDAAILELFHGPTLAFKDVALQLLPRLCSAYLESQPLHVICATSGDTGKAALEGFADVNNISLDVLYPKGNVSQMQEVMMLSQSGNNVQVYGVEGTFDDCQAIVKEALHTLPQLPLSSANSINIGRLLPQIVYYVHGYLQMVAQGHIALYDEIEVVVPSGNFGNLMAGYYAKVMGLPIRKFICASNCNRVLSDFFATGTYDIRRPFVVSNAPSMDILISSNIERFLYEVSGRNAEEIAGYMRSLAETGHFTVSKQLLERLQALVDAQSASEQEVLATIANTYQKHQVLVDPHTAVALAVNDKIPGTQRMICATASPYKFSQTVLTALNVEPKADVWEQLLQISQRTKLEIPTRLWEQKDKPQRFFDTMDRERYLQRLENLL